MPRQLTGTLAHCAALTLLASVLTLAGPRASSAQTQSAGTVRHFTQPSTGTPGSCPPGQMCAAVINDTLPPAINVQPMSGTSTAATSLAVTIDWCDDHGLNAASRYITLNGTAVTFSYTTSTASGCGAHATSIGTINLVMGSNVLHAEIYDNSGNSSSVDTYYTRLKFNASTVTPDNANVTAASNSDGVQYFTVQDSNSVPLTYSLSAHCTGAGLVTTTCTVSPTSLTVGAYQIGLFRVSYHTGTVGTTTGRVAGIAQANGGTDSGWVNVTVPAAYAVSASPHGTPKVVAISSSQSQVFSVTNTGNVTTTFNFTASCSGSIVTVGSCGVSPASASVAAGGNTNVTLSFTTTSAGTGNVALKATQATNPAAARDSGWVLVTTSTPLATVALARAFPGTTTEKGACLHFAVRAGVGSECGVLRVTHALPAVRTLNKARVPTLVYYFDQAGYSQVIGVNVTRAVAAAVPDSVRAILYQKNTDGSFAELQRRAWGGSAWAGTVMQRVALTMNNLAGGSSRIAPYRVQVDFKAPGGAWASAAPPVDGELAVVRREMAPGWNIAGVEALFPQSSSVLLWVGGDGSTRKYTYQDTLGGKRIFTAPALDSPDTVLQTITDNSYTRQAGSGLRVVFDATGLHTQTINRFGHLTTFTYVTGTRRLASITVPPASAGLIYQFNYDANGTLTTISAPGASGPRISTITPTATPRVIARIMDPDSTHVDFEYYSGSGSGLLMSAFTDRRGTRTTFDQDANAPTLAASHTPIGSSDVAQAFRTPSSMGASSTTAPLQIDSVYARYDGPRTDVVDVTKIWLGDFDVPLKVVDPLGASTVAVYGDPRFPLVATRVTRPRGLVTAAGYDARGNVVADTIYNPLGDGRNAVTSYAWDATWDMVTQIVSPSGILTRTAYDGTNANPLWRQTGDSTHRTTFSYYGSPDGLANGLLHWAKLPTNDSSEVRYDQTRGNARLSRSPLGFISMSLSDLIGRDTMTVAPIRADTTDSATVMRTGQRVRMHYDVASQVTDQWSENGPGMTPAETLQVHTTYDAGGLPLTVKRRSIPDTNAIGWISDSSAYDALGRDTLVAGAATVRRRYNLAGNVVWTNHGDSSVYDARGMRVTHLLPAVQWFHWPTHGTCRSRIALQPTARRMRMGLKASCSRPTTGTPRFGVATTRTARCTVTRRPSSPTATATDR